MSCDQIDDLTRRIENLELNNNAIYGLQRRITAIEQVSEDYLDGRERKPDPIEMPAGDLTLSNLITVGIWQKLEEFIRNDDRFDVTPKGAVKLAREIIELMVAAEKEQKK